MKNLGCCETICCHPEWGLHTAHDVHMMFRLLTFHSSKNNDNSEVVTVDIWQIAVDNDLFGFVLMQCRVLPYSTNFHLIVCRNFSDVSSLGKFGAFSVKLVFWMQVTGCVLRVVSSSLWIQMYRLGAAIDTADLYLPIDFDNRIGNFSSLNPGSPSPVANTRTMSMSDEVLGGSIYNPAVYSSILQSFNEDTCFAMEVRFM